MDIPIANKAALREWIGLAVISFPCMLYSMDVTVLDLAIPRISADLRPTSSELLWIVDIYGFFVASLLLPMGTLGDRVGRRRLLLLGAAAFGVASVLAALSGSTAMLIAARALLGIAGATLAPSTLSLIRHMFFDGGQRTFAIGFWTTSCSVGAAIGPLVGGVVLQHFWWGAVFLIGVPFMVLLLVLGPVLLPEFRNPSSPRMDFISAIQVLAAALPVIYGIKQLAAYGWHVTAVVSIIMGAVIGTVLVRRQTRSPNPLLDLRLLRSAPFTAALLAYTLGCFVAAGIYLFTAQYLQLVLGFSPLQAGLWTLPATFGLALGSLLTPALARRVPPTSAISAGFVLTAVGLTMISQIGPQSGIGILAAGLFVLYLGLAPIFIPAIDLMISSVPAARAGEVSALSETGSEFGAALGVAILGSIGTAVYRSTVVKAIPVNIGPEAARAARDTLGGALAAAQLLPDDLRIPLLNTARAAFNSGFHTVAILSAAIAIWMAITVVAVTRVRPNVHPKRDRAAHLKDVSG